MILLIDAWENVSSQISLLCGLASRKIY